MIYIKHDMTDATIIEPGATAPLPRFIPKPYLIVLYPQEQFRRVEIPKGTLLVGRSTECGLSTNDDLVSRQHCELSWNGHMVTVRDLNSTNGTFIDGAPVQGAQVLGPEQHLQLGKLILKVSFRDAAEIAFESELFEAATTDPLTRISNRRAFMERAQGEWASARRNDAWLHVLMLDVDHFKCINDSLGHPAGDFVLRELAYICNRVRRTEDLLARYGGEEFILLLAGGEPEQAIQFAERLRTTIASQHFSFEEKPIKLTVSIGLASRKGEQTPPLAELIARSDAALYQAKNAGRDRIESDCV